MRRAQFLVITSVVAFGILNASVLAADYECDCTTHVGSCQAQVQMSDTKKQTDSFQNITHQFQLSVSVAGSPACSDVSFQYGTTGRNAVIKGVPEYAVIFKGSFTKPVTVIGPWETVSPPSEMTCNICRQVGASEDNQSDDKKGGGNSASASSAARTQADIDKALSEALNNANAMSAATPARTLDPRAVEAAAQRTRAQADQSLEAEDAALSSAMATAAAQRSLQQGPAAASPTRQQKGGSAIGGCRNIGGTGFGKDAPHIICE